MPDKDCTVLPPEADPNPPTTSTTTTETPYFGMFSSLHFKGVGFAMTLRKLFILYNICEATVCILFTCFTDLNCDFEFDTCKYEIYRGGSFKWTRIDGQQIIDDPSK